MTHRILKSALLAVLAAAAQVTPAAAQDVLFLSTQLRPIEEATKMRQAILKGAGPVTFVVEEPPQFTVRMQAETEAGKRTVSLVGALHGELGPLVPMGALQPIDDVAAKLAGRGIPASLMQLGKLGTPNQQYIPWLQATYVMAAHKSALAHLPAGADVNALTYDQLLAWAKAVTEKTGKRALGFPAGPKGLMHRFFQGYFYPSFTGGVVSTFRSADAETGWAKLKELWQQTSPNSTSYDFMQEPLLAGEVLIAFDHIARLKDALAAKPNDFVTFPAPAGPKGRGYMPVVAGLAHPQGRSQPRRGRGHHRAPEQAGDAARDGRRGRLLPGRQGGAAGHAAARGQAARQRRRRDQRRQGRAALAPADRARGQGRRVQQGLHGRLPAHRAERRAHQGCAGRAGQGARESHARDQGSVLGA